MKYLKHLNRKILVYIIPGFYFVAYASFVSCELFNNSSLYTFCRSGIGILTALILSYVMGYLGFSIQKFFYSNEGRFKKEVSVIEIKKYYNFFIERYNELRAFRSNIVVISLIILFLTITIIIYLWFKGFKNFPCSLMITWGVIGLVNSFFFWRSSKKAKKDLEKRIKILNQKQNDI